ncbi:MAG TPA: multiheme c-type cytochrome [Polyangiaceae bacterium]
MLLGLATLGCQRDLPQTFAAPPGDEKHPTVIHAPGQLTSIETGEMDGLGRPVRVSCASCHSLRDAGPLPSSTQELDEFHVGLTFRHGSLVCASCHVQGRHDALHLADGELIPIQEALKLCTQCHGSQYRDYQRGAHGGMMGYWDTSRGQRYRNHCVDCHDPHSPKYEGTRPVAKPRDRIAPAGKETTHE